MATEGIEEYVNVIIFSSIYGLLLLIAAAHVIARWQLRRKSLNQWDNRVPGDKSFKNKSVRQQILEDFNTIQNLTSDPCLIGDTALTMGGRPYDHGKPSHWYRMKAFDSASKFVTTYRHLVEGLGRQPPSSHDFPRFLTLLRQKEILPPETSDVVTSSVSLYKNVRYETGVFSENDLDVFNRLLASLEQTLASNGLAPSVSSTLPTHGKPTTLITRDKATARYSLEPLLTPLEKQDSEQQEENDVLRSLTHSSSKQSSGRSRLEPPARFNRPVSLEIPLIDSQASTPLGSTSSPFFSHKTTDT